MSNLDATLPVASLTCQMTGHNEPRSTLLRRCDLVIDLIVGLHTIIQHMSQIEETVNLN